MSTTSSGISDLYTAVVADLVDFYSSAVLLPNQALISHSLNIADGPGKSVQFPLTDAWTVATSGLTEEQDIVAASPADASFSTSDSTITAVKRGAGTYVTEESLEDGQFDVVRNAVLTRLSGSVAEATDKAGFKVMLNNTETAPTNANVLVGTGANIACINRATVGADGGTIDLNVVFSPEAMGFMTKREISAQMEHDVTKDRYIMTGTVRNGFGQLRPGFMKAVGSISGSLATADNATLSDFAQAVALLRAGNAPADADGYYYACITPQVEYLLSSFINGVNGSTSLGSLSDIGNRALLQAVVSEAIGIRWLRTNNLVTGVTNTQ